MTEIITVLRNMAGGTGSTGADLVTFGQNHIREILAHIDAQAAEIERLPSRANAQLIAAAPDLLAEVIRLRAEVAALKGGAV